MQVITQNIKGGLTLNHNRNEKLDQVQRDTLVIGIDIAKFKHFACAFDDRGRELEKPFPVLQSIEGFHQFLEKVETFKQEHQKTDVIIGFEPTGHYWMNLAEFLRKHEILYVMVNPLHVNRAKEFEDNLQTKNDQKDSRVIARMVSQGYFTYPRVLTGIEAELREGSAHRNHLKKEKARLSNKIIQWLDRYFPELIGQAFKDIGRTVVGILKYVPLPEQWIDLEVDAFLKILKDKEAFRCPSRKKIVEVHSLASQSIGLTEGTTFAKQKIQWLISQYEQVCQSLEETKVLMQELAQELDAYEHLISIPGISEDMVCELLAEAGPLTAYQHPRQLIKLAGLTLRENSSGQHRGRKKLSKRGRRHLRALLFRATLTLVHNNQAFRDLYAHYISRDDNPLKKKEALVVLGSKLLKVFWGLSHHKMAFDAERMRRDSPLLQSTAALAS